MPRIATKDFTLNLAGTAPVSYKAGDVIEKDHEGHWWVKAHSEEPRKLSKKEQEAIDKATKAVADAQAAYDAAVQASEADAQNEQKLEAAIAAQDALKAASEHLDKLTKE